MGRHTVKYGCQILGLCSTPLILNDWHHNGEISTDIQVTEPDLVSGVLCAFGIRRTSIPMIKNVPR
jgi:hypothetical protein